jgi:hypothetical protein
LLAGSEPSEPTNSRSVANAVPWAVAEGADAIATTARIAAKLHENLCADGVEVFIDESLEGEKSNLGFRFQSRVKRWVPSDFVWSDFSALEGAGARYRCNGRAPELVRELGFEDRSLSR